ncbi:DUF4867 family protein [Pseudobutyrivibrio ruminis]|uniref:DUF4867 domain-containing protein n=1 Tax=Pseudobutyrivibrio ruminis DSM 9787 TaxID=1123011 RepID=A0A285T274_9FIRM|nr:DUF4867 family protein [Pseudobutyrivibrio ruminis]SOC15203.1 protein of unknown function [Pseudobutyrivibrio ruminis DSM 9787]
MLSHLNEVNDVKILSVFDDEFKTYGNVVTGYDFNELIAYMEKDTDIPENGNIYVASVPEMERANIVNAVRDEIFGGMTIQVGYCNGRNTTYNGFEYHKGSEINVAVTDFMLVLGHTWLIAKDGTYKVEDAKVFFVPKGTAIEMFQTTLHLSPCRVYDEGFKGIVILPQGTNTPLESKPANREGENKLLLQKNKWVIAHPEREPLIKQGAFPGLIGENKELKY